MEFKEMEVHNCYETGVNNLLEDFYIPVLKESTLYRRIAGFFSSTSLSVASKGIAGLIQNGGKMELIVCPRLSEEDITAITEAVEDPEQYIGMCMIEDLNTIDDTFAIEHVKALGWMIAKGLLEIRVALIIKDDGSLYSAEDIASSGIFHQKVGILSDKYNNTITFSGSVNETCSGWCSNIEEFKVFKSWVAEQDKYCDNDKRKFDEFWNNKRTNVKVIDLPTCVKEHLIKHASNDYDKTLSFENYKKKSEEIDCLDLLSLFDYQKDAIKMWEDNNRKLLFEMATGTGKTRTAIGCIWKTIQKEMRVVVVIATPQTALSMQWKREIEALKLPCNRAIIADSSNPKWRKDSELFLSSAVNGLVNVVIILTTHRTYSCPDFIALVKKYSNSIKFMLIGDEAHGLAASKTKQGLIEDYSLRLGLSATPSRWFDEIGTRYLYDFFGENAFEFDIGKALSTVLPTTKQTPLVNYFYEPYFVNLDEEELYEYVKLSKQITQFSNAKDDEKQKILENLLFKRANIQKNAAEKLLKLESILNNLPEIQNTLIFCSPEQIDPVMDILKTRGIKAHKITENQGTKPESKYSFLSERDYLIKCFKEERYQVLTAIKCLDEGIDIPTASIAILMSSSTNPREFIQRIGRVIRRAPGKKYAYIYDIIVKSGCAGLPVEIQQFEKKIYEKELLRASDIAKYAINSTDAVNKLIFNI